MRLCDPAFVYGVEGFGIAFLLLKKNRYKHFQQCDRAMKGTPILSALCVFNLPSGEMDRLCRVQSGDLSVFG